MATVWMEAASEPLEGSVRQKAAQTSPGRRVRVRVDLPAKAQLGLFLLPHPPQLKLPLADLWGQRLQEGLSRTSHPPPTPHRHVLKEEASEETGLFQRPGSDTALPTGCPFRQHYPAWRVWGSLLAGLAVGAQAGRQGCVFPPAIQDRVCSDPTPTPRGGVFGLPDASLGRYFSF